MFLPYSLVSCTNIANYYLKGTKINSNINVIDGDTVSFLENDKKKYIRLFGIDTPETFKNDNKKLAKFENYYAHQASDFFKSYNPETKNCFISLLNMINIIEL